MNRINNTSFLEVEELRKQLEKVDLNKDDYRAGGVPLSAEGSSAWVDAADNHTIVFGATGSKKTRMLVMPTVEILSRAGESFVVTDPKGEVHSRTSGGMERRGYQVFTLNLRDYDAGESWNPLLLPYQYYREGDVSKAVELVSSIASMLIENDLSDAYWSNTARDVAIGLILLLFAEASGEEECNIKKLLALWQRYQQDKKAFRKMVKEDYRGTIIGDKLQNLDNSSDKTVGSIEAVFATGINRFSSNDKLIDYLSRPGMCFDEMVGEKTAIYLIIPDENKFYHFIVSLFLEQFYEVLIKEAQKAADVRLATRMNFVVDEFANLPKIDNIDCMITASRSRNIRFVLIVQSMNQLTEKYNETAQVICSNCNNWIYLYSKEYDLLTQISRLCGEVIYDNNMHMPLMSEFNLQHLSKEKGEALVLCERNYPCLVNLLDIDEYPFERTEPRVKKREQELGKTDAEQSGAAKASAEKQTALSAYTCEVPEELLKMGRIPSFLQKRKEEGSEKVWLVAAFEGMILRDYLVEQEVMQNGTVVMEKCLQDFALEEAAQLQWYRGSEKLHQKYAEHLRENPELVYLTVEELNAMGGEKLLREANALVEWGNACRKIPASRLRKWDRPAETLSPASIEVLLDGSVKKEQFANTPAWGGKIGFRYRQNIAFREANRVLQGTKLAAVKWELDEVMISFPICVCTTYQKKIDDENSARLSVYCCGLDE